MTSRSATATSARAGTFCQMALDAWAPADGARARAVRLGGSRPSRRCARATSTPPWCRSRTRSRAGSAPRSTPSRWARAVVITGEVLVPVTFVLAARPGTRLEDVRAVGTHPHGWAQVRTWMSANLPSAVYLTTLSTAAAAADLDARGRATSPHTRPPSAPPCGRDDPRARGAGRGHRRQRSARSPGSRSSPVRDTRRRRPAPTRPPWSSTSATTTRVACSSCSSSSPPAGVNMTRLESRPTGEAMGSYCFSIDIEGHVARRAGGRDADGPPAGMRRRCATSARTPARTAAPRRRSWAPATRSSTTRRRWLEGLRG